MRRRKKTGINPAVAVCLLVISAGVAGKSFLDMSKRPAAAPARQVEVVAAIPGIDQEPGSDQQARAARWIDLLAKHGSFDGRTQVRVAFSVLEEARTAVPGGEMVGEGAYWEGPDPPELQLGVVMISERSRRAVLGGQVVGISDDVAGVVVQSITRDRIVTLWNSKVLTYDLDNGWPREFRAELERRRNESATSYGAGGADQVRGAAGPEAGAQENKR